MARSFYAETKRVSNRLLKQELKIRMTFRTDEQMNVITAKKREKAHKIFDRQKDHELDRLREHIARPGDESTAAKISGRSSNASRRIQHRA